MAVTTRVELIEYCLRRLGFPVIEINVDTDQIEDRIDDGLDFYMDYHFDGTERTYFAVEVSQADIDNGYVTVPDSLIFVTRALPFPRNGSVIQPIGDPNASWDIHHLFGGAFGTQTGSGNVSSRKDQAGRSNDMAMTTYYLNMQYLETIQQMFGNGEVPIRFNRHTNRVHLDMDWSEASINVGDYIVLHGWTALDPDTYPDVYNDRWLKRYCTALIKRQWGANLIKYSGIQLPGGVTLDGDKIFDEASQEIEKLEEEMQDKYEEPPMPLME